MLVRRARSRELSDGGIIIVEHAKEKKLMGEVIRVGPGKRTRAGDIIPMDVRDGDHVLFGRYAGTEITLDGDSLLIIKQDDVLMVLDRTE
jgi:chaperonin GroES